jgi:hypothetical protein
MKICFACISYAVFIIIDVLIGVLNVRFRKNRKVKQAMIRDKNCSKIGTQVKRISAQKTICAEALTTQPM